MKIFVNVKPSLFALMFSEETTRQLRQCGDVEIFGEERNLSAQELAARLPGVDVLVTSWGAPRFRDALLEASGGLKLIAHAAGSVKGFLPPEVFRKGVRVTHAAGAIAAAVADLSLLLTMLMLREAHVHDANVRQGKWRDESRGLGEEIGGQRIGVVGAGYTGRCFIKLLKALECDVWVYDPYLPESRAVELGVKKVELADLMRSCRVISIQAPPTEETRGMIGARELALMQDGGILINTARAVTIDQAALAAELKAGRLRAALDVFEQEPLPPDSPWLEMPGVFLTPHIAGASKQARLRQGQYMVEEIRRFHNGEPLRYEVKEKMLATMA
jgi:phosphoglycerate dehydrogenase-like enzyme